MGSAQSAYYAELLLRSMIVGGIKVDAAPFDRPSEDVWWKSVTFQPAHVTLALRVQGKAVKQYAPLSSSAIHNDDTLAEVIQQDVQTRQAELEKGLKKETLSYTLQTRVKEVGLSGMPDLPSADAMIRLESGSQRPRCKVATMLARQKARITRLISGRHGPGTQSWTPWWKTLLLKTKSVILLTRKNRGPNGIRSTISACQLPKSCAERGRQVHHHECHGPCLVH